MTKPAQVMVDGTPEYLSTVLQEYFSYGKHEKLPQGAARLANATPEIYSVPTSRQNKHRRKNVCDENERLPGSKYENHPDKQRVKTAGMKQTNGKKGRQT